MQHQIKKTGLMVFIIIFSSFGLAACDSGAGSPTLLSTTPNNTTTRAALADSTTSATLTATAPSAPAASSTPVLPTAVTATTPATTAPTVAPTTTVATTTNANTTPPTTTVAPTQTAVDTSKPRYIEAMRARSYNSKGPIELGALYEQTGQYKANLISYESDGLHISGLMYVPSGKGPFPLVLVNHGYFDPSNYGPGWDTLRELRYFAANGYVTIASDYRNYGSSSKGDNTIIPGYTNDILNLIEAARKTDFIDKSKITIMGHSMGGEITQDVLVVSKDIKVAALFGSMSADAADNYYARRDLYHSNDVGQYAEFYGTPDKNPDNYKKLSTLTYFKDITVPVEINVGTNDKTTPPEWSQKIYNALKTDGKTAEFYTYAGEGHSLNGAAFNLAMQRTLAFFNRAIGK